MIEAEEEALADFRDVRQEFDQSTALPEGWRESSSSGVNEAQSLGDTADRDKTQGHQDIVRTVKLLFEPGQIMELRTFVPEHSPTEYALISDDRDEIAEKIIELEDSCRFKGIYVVLNPIRAFPEENSLTKDSDIASRRWLLVDIDAKRADSKQASTDSEHQAALDKSFEIRSVLADMGWPEPIRGDSGNGAHLLYRIDLPNDESSRMLVEGVLRALGEMFNCDSIDIDRKVGNASRISKVYGTTVRKGDDSPEHPWRKAQLLDVPDKMETVPRGLLETLANSRKVEKRDRIFQAAKKTDIAGWIEEHGLKIVKVKRLERGTLYVIQTCPWNAEHDDRAFYITQWDDGNCFAACHHNHCQGKGWPDLLALFGEEDLFYPIRKVSQQSPPGSIGIDEDGSISRVVENKEGPELVWVSDCVLWASVETNAKDTEITFEGYGAKDSRRVRFTLNASDVSEHRNFKSAITHAFGIPNRMGGLTWEIVQRISCNPKRRRRVEIPVWDGDQPMVPGLGSTGDVEFSLSPRIPVQVLEGDLSAAREYLRNLLEFHENASIVVAAVFASPAVARWHHNDRFGVAIWAETGSFKTEFMKHCNAVYGTGYVEESNLLKCNSSAGTTRVAALARCAAAGMVPQILDNVKTEDEKDIKLYIDLVQTIIEGSDKARGKRDGTEREDSKEFFTTLMITGEIKPDEASTTARIINVSWSKEKADTSKLDYIQAHLNDAPAAGYCWLRFLAETDLNLVEGFAEARARKLREFSEKRFVNPGRLATNYVLLRSTWNLLCQSPLGEVFAEFRDGFVAALDRTFEEQGEQVTSETEVARFLAGLRELVASCPNLFLRHESSMEEFQYGALGKFVGGALFVLPNLVLDELNQRHMFRQKPTVKSMARALDDRGLLIKQKGNGFQYKLRLNGKPTNGWLLAARAIEDEAGFDTEEDNGGNVVSEEDEDEERRDMDITAYD